MTERRILICDINSVPMDTLHRMQERGWQIVEKRPGAEVRIEPQMTLRDQFAMAAMQGVGLNSDGPTRARIAEMAYKQADAMLAARENNND